MRILFVCTANICRSASAQQLMRESVGVAPELAHVEVLSAGTDSIPGARGCLVAPALDGHSQAHRSLQLTAEFVQSADLILSAARDHRPAIVGLDLASRNRTFTIRQASRIADWLLEAGMVDAARERALAAGEPTAPGGDEAWADRFAPGDRRRDVEPMPVNPEDIAQWLVAEMDAARGATVVPIDAEALPTELRRRFRLPRTSRKNAGGEEPRGPVAGAGASSPAGGANGTTLGAHADDVPDPHVLGTGLHSTAYEQIRTSTDSLTRLLREVWT